MGWERKRGKLREFNRLLRGARDTSYILSTADLAFLARTRYVITLDADTIIPREAARRLIATISHPLNRPKLDISLSRVIRGYVIMQPQINSPPPMTVRSRIPKLLSNYIRVDPDIIFPWNLYQELFGEGLYVGKGLYDVDAFEATLKDRVPENTFLSHDIYEGVYARTALVTDVIVHEGDPPRYIDAKQTLHRWVRGDWQVLPRLWSYGRNANGNEGRNALTILSRWKLLDSMRSSLGMPSVLLWLVAAWTVLPGSPILWTLLILLVIALSIWLSELKLTIVRFQNESSRNSIFREAINRVKVGIRVMRLAIMGTLFFIIMLADQSYTRIDAIIRTLYRMTISRKHLLEWIVAIHSREYVRYTPSMYLRHMWPAIMTALIIGALIFIKHPTAFIPAAFIIIAWCLSPFVVYWMDNRNGRNSATFESQAERDIRINGRRRWQELERYNTSNDNNQHIHYRTQSTATSLNHAGSLPVKLLRRLYWNVAAHDLGCVGTIELAERLADIIARIIKHQTECANHCNCDDISLLNFSTPTQVVAIENGNLAGHFTALKHVFTEIINRPLLNERALKGIADTISLMAEEIGLPYVTKPVKECASYPQLREEIEKCAELVSPRGQIELPQTIAAWDTLLTSLTRQAAIVGEKIKLSSQGQVAGDGRLRYWADSLISQTREFKRDLDILTPLASARDSKFAAIGELNYTPTFECVPALSRIPEVADIILNKLTTLRDKCMSIDEACPADVLSAFNAQISAVKGASEASTQLLSRYTRITNQSEAITGIIDYRHHFDAEYQAMFVNLQLSSTNKTFGRLF
jgi:cyclic beta-1,2-glucan synthetase